MTDDREREEENPKQQPNGRRSPSRVPAGLLWLVLGAIVGIFSIYEIIERSWLSDADEQLLRVFHIIRGVGSSLVVALLAVWYLLRSSPSIFPSQQPESGWTMQEDSSDEDRIIHFSAWFIRMRWLACVMGTVLVIVSIRVLRYLEEQAFAPLCALILLLVFSNILFSQMLKRRWCIRYLAEIQVGTDLLILTAMLHFSGGLENPMAVAYIFHIIIGGILLDRRKCYTIVFVASLLFIGLASAEQAGYLKHYTLLVLPHGTQQGRLGPVAYERLREVIGSSMEGSAMNHASHEPVYVVSMVILQMVLMMLTAYFITTIMEQLRAGEKHRQAAGQRLERVVQATGAGFAILDRDLHSVWLNDQIRQWLNLSDSQTHQDLALLDRWTGAEGGPAASTLRDGKVRAVERTLPDTNGNKRFFQTTVAPLTDSSGDVYQVVELTQDITEHKLMEAEAMHTGKLATLGFMAAGIAHEVGNPLASISTRLRLLERDPQESFLKESLPLLMQQIDRISRIVHDISSFSRPGETEWRVCQVNVIILELTTILRFHKKRARIEIGTDLAENLPDIRVNRDQLTAVFLNLGLNALEAMVNGGTLTIKTHMCGEAIGIVFTDTGPGISEEVFPRLFTPFFSNKQGGLGLGLSIAQRMMLAHGGHIDAENHPQGGAVFTAILPKSCYTDLRRDANR